MGHHKMQGLPLVLYCFKDRTWSNQYMSGFKAPRFDVWLILPMTFHFNFIHKSFDFRWGIWIHHCNQWWHLWQQTISLQVWLLPPGRAGVWSSSPSSQGGGFSSRSCCLADLAMVESQNTKLKPSILESENWWLLIGQIIGSSGLDETLVKQSCFSALLCFEDWTQLPGKERAKVATFWANSEVFQPLLKSVASSHPTSGTKHEKQQVLLHIFSYQ